MKFKFQIYLPNSDYSEISNCRGLLFSKFLPKDSEDSLEIKLKDGKINFWFERRGFHDEDGFIIHDLNKKEISESVIHRQGIIEGGPLFGILQLDTAISKFNFKENEIENEELIKITKTLVKIIDVETQKILDLLRFNFGQYWIIDNINWDSRFCSLGHHCKYTLHLQWFDDENKFWNDLIPNNPSATITADSLIKSDFSDYMTNENWEKLKNLLADEHSPSIGQRYLIEAYTSLDSGALEKAFIDAVTVLEIALDQYYKSIREQSSKVGIMFNRIKDLGNKEQLINIFVNNNTITKAELEDAIDAIDLRNKIVHERYVSKTADKPKLLVLFKLISLLIGEPISKLVSPNTGNFINPRT